MRAVTVIGVGDDGCVGLSSRAMGAVARAQVLAGGERHLEFFPQFDGEKIVFKGEILKAVDRIAELSSEHTVCVLASGDPLFFGIGNLIGKKVGRDHVEFIPAPSSVQWAFAKIGMSWEDAEIISLHGKPIEGLVARLQRTAKAACFTDGKNTPQIIARHLASYGETGWTAYVCGNLGGKEEKIQELELTALAEAEGISDLNVLILIRVDPSRSWRPSALLPFAPEEDYAKRMPKNGLITKREVRALSLAALELRSDSVVWDIGAGSGSVAIEAGKLATRGRIYAIEVDPEGAEICRQNLLMHRTDHVKVVEGRAPEALTDLPDPDAVFIGGSKGSMAELVEICMRRLRTGGRIVVNAVTLDNVAEAYRAFRAQGILPEVTLLQISRGQKLADYLRYEALNPIHIFSATKKTENPS